MDTGVLSIILHQFPYPSHWTKVISAILFVVNIALFIIFGLTYLAHWSIYYKTTSAHVRAEAEEIALQACPAISWLTIATDVQLFCGSWGYGFTILAYVMWWISVVWMVTICVLLFLHLMKYASTRIVDQLLPTAVFIPAVGLFTVANLAGIIATQTAESAHVTSGMITSTIVTGFLLVGFGGGLAMIMYGIYMHRLMTSGWPPALKIPSMILTVRTFLHSYFDADSIDADRSLWSVSHCAAQSRSCCCSQSPIRYWCWLSLDGRIRERTAHPVRVPRDLGIGTRGVLAMLRLLCHI